MNVKDWLEDKKWLRRILTARGLVTLTGGVVVAVGAIATVAVCYNSDMCSLRMKVTDPTVQEDTVREVQKDTFPPSATVFVLELISLKCNRRQERRRDAPDEAYLKVMDETVTEPFKMDEGHMVNLDHLGPYLFVGSAEIELWDNDPEGNPDEYLGNTFARESDHNKEEEVVSVEFTGSGARYVLEYRVRKRSGAGSVETESVGSPLTLKSPGSEGVG